MSRPWRGRPRLGRRRSLLHETEVLPDDPIDPAFRQMQRHPPAGEVIRYNGVAHAGLPRRQRAQYDHNHSLRETLSVAGDHERREPLRGPAGE